MLNHIMHSNQQVVTHPVEHLTADDIASLPELPMTQAEDGTWCCDGESTQVGTPSPDNPIPITNTYPAGTYKAVCGDKVYKVVLDDDLRSVPGVADRVTIDAGRGLMRVERKAGVAEFDGSENWVQTGTTGDNYQVFALRSESYNALSGYHATMSNIFMYDDNERVVNSCRQRPVGSTGFGLRFTISTDIVPNKTVDELKAYLAQRYTDGVPAVFYYVPHPTTRQSIPPQLITISAGRSAQLTGTVNDKADYLAVKGDSWQLVQDEIVDADGNVIQPAMPSPEYQSEIKDVDGVLRSSGWNYYSGSDIEGTQNNNSGIIQTIQPGTYTFMADVESSDTDNTKCFILFYNGTIMLNGVIIGRGKGAQTTVTISENVTKFTCYASNSNLNSLGDTFSFRNIQITKGTTTHPYDRHRGNSITLPALRGLPDGTRDVLYVDRKAKRAWVERKVGLVESYNGESVGDLFMSNTGELSTGAVVHYKLATPVTEELPYSDYLLEMCQYETNINFVDCNENLVPEIEVGCKVLGR